MTDDGPDEPIAGLDALRGDPPAPPELWPLVAGATVHAPMLRARLLRSLWPRLAAGAAVLMFISALAGAWLTTGREGTLFTARLETAIREDRALESQLSARMATAAAEEAGRLRDLQARLTAAREALEAALAGAEGEPSLAAQARALTDLLERRDSLRSLAITLR